MTTTPPQNNDRSSIPERLAAIESQLEGVNDLFSRRTNTLLDEIVVLNDQMSATDRRIDRLAQQMETLTSNQLETRDFVNQLARVAMETQAEIRQIWEYLLQQRPNGHNE